MTRGYNSSVPGNAKLMQTLQEVGGWNLRGGLEIILYKLIRMSIKGSPKDNEP